MKHALTSGSSGPKCWRHTARIWACIALAGAAALAPSAQAQPTCVTPPANMVAWWPGDNAPNDIVSANNGTLQGGAGYTAGKVALAFSVAAAADFVNVPHDPSIDFGTGDFSIDAWVRTTSTETATIADKREFFVGPKGYTLTVLSGKLTFQLGDGGTFVGNHVGVHSDINDNAWHHVAVTVSGRTAGGGNLYVDGVNVLNFSTSLPAGGDLSNAADLRIGQRQTFSPPNAFAGAIDELEIFNREHDSTELQAIYLAYRSRKCKPRNHFKTWRIDTLEVNHFVEVQDEFMTDSLQLHAIEFLSNPARKDTSGIKRPNDHLHWYRARGRDTLLQVVYENQFGVDSIFIDSVTHLLVPCRKDPHPWPDSLLGHYKAYRINDASKFARAVEIEDQFDSLPEFIDTLLPVYFLTPASKNFEPIPHPDTHYVAYEISPKTASTEFRFTTDQFDTYPMSVEQSELLLVPTRLISVRDSLGTIQGVKWWDKDRDCVIDNPQEYPLLSGWPIKLDPGGIIKTTDAAGYYNFTVQPGTYTVSEVHPLPSGWVQICPTPASSYAVTVGAGQTVTGLNFGNDTLQSKTSIISETDKIHCQVDSANDLHITYWSDTRMSIKSHWDGPFTNFEVVCDSVVQDPVHLWRWWSYYTCTWSGYMAHKCEWVTVGVEFSQESNNTLHKSGYWTLDGNPVGGSLPLTGMSVVPPVGTGPVTVTLYNDASAPYAISDLEVGFFPTVRSLSEMAYDFGAIGPVRPDSIVLASDEWWDSVVVSPAPPHALLAQGYASGPSGEAYFVTQHEHPLSCPIVVNGDVNESGNLTAADIITLVGYVFKGGPPPEPCAANGDVNCSGAVTAADIIYMVAHIFKGGPLPCDICNEPGAMECVPNP